MDDKKKRLDVDLPRAEDWQLECLDDDLQKELRQRSRRVRWIEDGSREVLAIIARSELGPDEGNTAYACNESNQLVLAHRMCDGTILFYYCAVIACSTDELPAMEPELLAAEPEPDRTPIGAAGVITEPHPPGWRLFVNDVEKPMPCQVGPEDVIRMKPPIDDTPKETVPMECCGCTGFDRACGCGCSCHGPFPWP
jgi:hypothetical protein